MSVTIALSESRSRFNREDFPALGFPISAKENPFFILFPIFIFPYKN